MPEGGGYSQGEAAPARGQWPACALTADPPRALRPPAPAPRDVRNVIGHHFRICGSRCPGNTEECRSRARAAGRSSAGGCSRRRRRAADCTPSNPRNGLGPPVPGTGGLTQAGAPQRQGVGRTLREPT